MSRSSVITARVHRSAIRLALAMALVVTLPAAAAVASSAPRASIEPSATATAQAEPCFGAEASFDAIVVDDGHFDLGIQVDSGVLSSRVKDDRADPPVWRDPASMILRLDAPSAQTVPDSPAFSFLGAPGATVWGIGQSQEDAVPWLGWNTQHSSAIEGVDGGTRWTLDSVDGPGELFIYQTGSFGDLTQVMGTAAGWPRSVLIPANTHAHGNWSFTQAGVYRVTTTHTATLRTGAVVTSQATLTFLVGPCTGVPQQPEAQVPDASLMADAELVDGNRGGVSVTPATVSSGDTTTISAPEAAPGSWYMPVFYSTPQQTTWTVVSAQGSMVAAVPPLAPGSHKVALYDASGTLIGWSPLTVTTAPDDEAGPTPTPAPTRAPTPDPTSTPKRSPDAEVSKSDETASAASPDSNGSSRTPAGNNPAATVCRSGDAQGNGSAGSSGGSGDSSGGSGSEVPSTGDPVPGGGSGAVGASSVSTGHFDFGSQIQAGRLVPRVKDDRTQPPKWVDPASLTFALGAKAAQKVPDSSAYSFLGPAGSTVWLIPQTQVDGIPWLGWNTQDESVRSQVKGKVTFHLDEVSGPGKLGVYLTDSFGGVGEKKFGTMAGFGSSFSVPINVHAHGNWAFSAAGTYRVTMTQSATLVSGQKVSAPATLTFVVGGSSAGPASLRGESGETPVHAHTVSTTAATPLPTVDAASNLSATSPSASGPTCVLPAAGAPDVVWLLGAGVLLLALGIVATTAAATSPRRTAS